jgi:hypothetical protein
MFLKSPVTAVRSPPNVLANVEASVSKPPNKSLFTISSLDRRLLNSLLAPAKFAVTISAITVSPQPPANTSELPAATDVQAVIASPILPQPNPLTLTVDEPDVIGAEWGGHGAGGFLCTVLVSDCLLTAIPLANTFDEPTALVIPEQCGTSASPILVTAGICILLSYKQL